MNFFEHQEHARRRTRRLLWLFALAVLAIVVAVDAAVLAGLGLASQREMAAVGGAGGLLRAHPGLLAGASLITLATIGLASLTRMATLRGGGAAVAKALGATPVSEDSSDFQYRRLRNVVEEIAIASGVPVPAIYVMEQEAGINAFAAGWSPADAAVTVTRGTLERLNRDELQGVIAHEFSHVLNGDMRLNIRLMGALFGILVLALAGRAVLRHTPRGRNSKGAGGVMLIALVLMIVGYAGVFFGRLIKAGVSRQREFLADASAVQFTRQTQGLAGALKKIAGLAEGSKLGSVKTEEVSHMLFGDGLGLRGLFATHPPLLARIRALEPGFRPEQIEDQARRWRQSPPSGQEEDRALGLAVAPVAGAMPPPTEAAVAAPSPAEVAARAGAPAAADYLHAEALLAALPVELVQAARGEDAAALVLALLLAADPAVRVRQIGLLEGRHPPRLRERAGVLAALCLDLHPQLRLPLAELAFPALRRLPRPELAGLDASVAALIRADGQTEVFEYALGALLRAQVHGVLDPSRYWRPGRRKLHQAQGEAVALLTVLANRGHADPAAARRAFLAGLARLYPGRHVEFAPAADWVASLDAGWPLLEALRPEAKAVLVEALVAVSVHDGRIAAAESELLRTVCGMLQVPLPAAALATGRGL